MWTPTQHPGERSEAAQRVAPTGVCGYEVTQAQVDEEDLEQVLLLNHSPERQRTCRGGHRLTSLEITSQIDHIIMTEGEGTQWINSDTDAQERPRTHTDT